MPYNHPIPDAPIAGSMLPRAASVDSSDLLVLIKPNNPLGQKNKAVEVGALLASSPLTQAMLTLGISKVSQVLDFSGALGNTNANTYIEVAHLDIDPRWDVIFHVWGESTTATNTTGAQDEPLTRYDYGLRGRVRQYWAPDDQDRDQEARFYAGHKEDTDGPLTPVYNGFFSGVPYDYNPSAGELRFYPTKRVTLYLSSGSSVSPYQCTAPSSFTLKIQAICTLRAIDTNLLQATEG